MHYDHKPFTPLIVDDIPSSVLIGDLLDGENPELEVTQ